MNVSYDVTGTLRTQMGGHPPLVLVYDARGNGGGRNMPDNHGRSSEPGDGLHGNRGARVYDPDRRKADCEECGEICVTLTAKMGTGGAMCQSF